MKPELAHITPTLPDLSRRAELCVPQNGRRLRRLQLLLTALVVLMWGLWLHPQSRPSADPEAPGRPTIVFMTDFGTSNDAVPICKGVMLSVAPNANIIDLTHQVTPYSVFEGARYLYGTTPYFPAGTVFVVVIDPGVGSSRKALIVKSKRGQYFVLPDNGLITLIEQRDGIEGAREITNPAWMLRSALSSTFHGRDIFSPAAAHVARGEDWRKAGPQVNGLVRLKLNRAKVDAGGITGEIVALDDPYGSLISNIGAEEFRKLGYRLGDQVSVLVGGRQMTIPYAKTFSDVPIGKPLLYIDSRGQLALAVNQESFSRNYHLKPPSPIFIPIKTTAHP